MLKRATCVHCMDVKAKHCHCAKSDNKVDGLPLIFWTGKEERCQQHRRFQRGQSIWKNSFHFQTLNQCDQLKEPYIPSTPQTKLTTEKHLNADNMLKKKHRSKLSLQLSCFKECPIQQQSLKQMRIFLHTTNCRHCHQFHRHAKTTNPNTECESVNDKRVIQTQEVTTDVDKGSVCLACVSVDTT